jgi:N-glycosylase/DNA lyase
VADYDLAKTLTSGQSFRWTFQEGAWEGVVHSRWVRLLSSSRSIVAQTAEPVDDWTWLENYLQVGVDLGPVLAAFPVDGPMRLAVGACRGLRLLRQDPWECLASFILSSTKQIVQIQQVIGMLCARFGQPVRVPSGYPPACSFPSAERLSQVSEPELRACKMGFRAPYLQAAAHAVVDGKLDLRALAGMSTAQARAELLQLPGVGRKIADCVLLFAFGFQAAFPVDVWVARALRELYFPGEKVNASALQQFSDSYFRPYAGYAQQYLFHYLRIASRPPGIGQRA